MSPELEARIAALEAQLVEKPDSRPLREEVLEAFCSEPGELDDARRLPHIIEYIERFPHSSFARCPLAHLRTDAPAAAHAAVEAAWQSHVDDYPSDPLMIRGLACSVANHDRARAGEILESFVCDTPDAEVWMDMGRIHPDAQTRLASFLQARKLGSTQPNLLAWIAETAIGLDDLEMVEHAGRELLALVDEARRTHGDRIDWRDREILKRARAETASKGEARTLVRAIANAAQHKHWGHTALGVVAARRGDLAGAIDHLHASIAVHPDPRLTSYGPSFRLAAALCQLDAWSEVAKYLQACEAFWHVETLRAYRSDVEQQRMPAFEEN